MSQVALYDGGRDDRNRAHLIREITAHFVDIVSKLAPDALNERDLGHAAQFTLRAHLESDTVHLRRQSAQLQYHAIHGVLEIDNLAVGVDFDLFG